MVDAEREEPVEVYRDVYSEINELSLQAKGTLVLGLALCLLFVYGCNSLFVVPDIAHENWIDGRHSVIYDIYWVQHYNRKTTLDDGDELMKEHHYESLANDLKRYAADRNIEEATDPPEAVFKLYP